MYIHIDRFYSYMLYTHTHIYVKREEIKGGSVEGDSCYMVTYADGVCVMLLFYGGPDLRLLTRGYSCGPGPAGEDVLGWCFSTGGVTG